jgi:hypothetical protein
MQKIQYQAQPTAGSTPFCRTLIPIVTLLLLPPATLLRAQEPAAPQPPPTTMHVYENLKQLPVLVLTAKQQRMKPVDPANFRVRLDSAPPFAPTYVRQEGDEPIELAIVIDISKPDSELLPDLSQAISALAPTYLKPQDRISVYAIDCSFIRAAFEVPAAAASLKASVDLALTPWQTLLKMKHPPPPCKATFALWDAMANVLDDIDERPGHRVMLVITDGLDEGSKTRWPDVMKLAQIESVAVFGIRSQPTISSLRAQEKGYYFEVERPDLRAAEDDFKPVCELSGGIELQTKRSNLGTQLQEAIQMVRERYILEFPRNPNETPGVHGLAVTYLKSSFYIRPSGIAVPPATEEELKGTNTLHTDPTHNPPSAKSTPPPTQ